MTLIRTVVADHPASRSSSSNRGVSCLSLAATEPLAASNDQPSRSTGPGFTWPASRPGNAGRIVWNRAFESRIASRNLASGALPRRASVIDCAFGVTGGGFWLTGPV